MTTVLLVKHVASLRPVDDAGAEWLRHVGQGEIVEVTARRPRNVRFHRLFFALASLCWEQAPDRAQYPTVEDYVTALKIATGHYTRREADLDGVRMTVLTPRSISFAAMDEDEFKAWFDRCCDWVAVHVLPGVSRDDLRAELEAMLGLHGDSVKSNRIWKEAI